MTEGICAMLVYDRRASAGGPVRFRPCGAPATVVVVIRGDYMFRACSRHNRRLERAGISRDD